MEKKQAQKRLKDQNTNYIYINKKIKKTDDKYSFPFLKFNQSLNDKDLMEIIKKPINYFSRKMNNDYVEEIKARLLE